MLDRMKISKDYQSYNPYFGGPEQIRTAVEAFAELCLATRPQDHLIDLNGENKVVILEINIQSS